MKRCFYFLTALAAAASAAPATGGASAVETDADLQHRRQLGGGVGGGSRHQATAFRDDERRRRQVRPDSALLRGGEGRRARESGEGVGRALGGKKERDYGADDEEAIAAAEGAGFRAAKGSDDGGKMVKGGKKGKEEAAVAVEESAVATATTSTTYPPGVPAPATCNSDSDCRVQSWYCNYDRGHCACAAARADPIGHFGCVEGSTLPLTGDPCVCVHCFADPCMGKEAFCDAAAGICALRRSVTTTTSNKVAETTPAASSTTAVASPNSTSGASSTSTTAAATKTAAGTTIPAGSAATTTVPVSTTPPGATTIGGVASNATTGTAAAKTAAPTTPAGTAATTVPSVTASSPSTTLNGAAVSNSTTDATAEMTETTPTPSTTTLAGIAGLDDDNSTTPSTSSAPPPESTSSVAAAPGPSICTTDDECSARSVYCRFGEGRCGCEAHHSASPGGEGPVCKHGEMSPFTKEKCTCVSCFVDPCMGKEAACYRGEGVCVMRSASSSSSPSGRDRLRKEMLANENTWDEKAGWVDYDAVVSVRCGSSDRCGWNENDGRNVVVEVRNGTAAAAPAPGAAADVSVVVEPVAAAAPTGGVANDPSISVVAVKVDAAEEKEKVLVQLYPTVEDLFEFIRATLDEDEYVNMSVRYDTTLGHPEEISVEYDDDDDAKGRERTSILLRKIRPRGPGSPDPASVPLEKCGWENSKYETECPWDAECCNRSCGKCAPLGNACTKEWCSAPADEDVTGKGTTTPRPDDEDDATVRPEEATTPVTPVTVLPPDIQTVPPPPVIVIKPPWSEGSGIDVAAELVRLDAAVARWNQSGPPEDYEYTFRRSCYCYPGTLGPFDARVEKGKVVKEIHQFPQQIDWVPPGIKVDPGVLTIPEFFEYVRNAINQKPAGLTVQYDDTFGFPTSFSVDYYAMMADDEMSLVVSNFAVVDVDAPTTAAAVTTAASDPTTPVATVAAIITTTSNATTPVATTVATTAAATTITIDATTPVATVAAVTTTIDATTPVATVSAATTTVDTTTPVATAVATAAPATITTPIDTTTIATQVAQTQDSSDGTCQADSDCRTYFVTCGDGQDFGVPDLCSCAPLGAMEPEPPCDGPMAKCFRNSCDDFVAKCKEGLCALEKVP